VTGAARWRQRVGFVLAFAWLHALAVVPLHAPELYALAACEVPIDLLLVFAVAVVGAAAGWPRLAAAVGAGCLMLSAFSRLCEVVSALAFHKDFELVDIGQLWAIFLAWSDKAAVWERWLSLGVILVSVVCLAWLTARSLRAVTRGAAHAVVGCCWLVALQLVVLAALVCPQRPFSRSPLATFASVVADGVRGWLDPEARRAPLRDAVAAAARRMREVPHDLALLDGADVHVLVVESYGRVALRHPDLRARTTRVFAGLEEVLRDAGLAACSAALAPAVCGGRSGLAHAELLTGARVPSEQARELLMASDVVALPKRFRACGYETCEVQPGMPIHWPEGDAFYGFDRSIIQPELGYEGARYDFGAMPDQFALGRLLDRCVRPAKQPVFTMYVGVSSHAPWTAVPPFAPDWDLTSIDFAAEPAVRHDTYYLSILRDPAVVPAYATSLEYVLRASVGFATQAPRPSVVVVVGDHQPPIAGSLSPADPSHDVPVHVISSDPRLLQPLREAGFCDGLDVPAELEARPMAALAPLLLEAWSRGSAVEEQRR